MNYPPTPEAMGWASDFIDLCFFTEVLFGSPSIKIRCITLYIVNAPS